MQFNLNLKKIVGFHVCVYIFIDKDFGALGTEVSCPRYQQKKKKKRKEWMS